MAIEPETSYMPGKGAKPTISTQVNMILHHLRCDAGGAHPVKVRNEYGTRQWTEHHD